MHPRPALSSSPSSSPSSSTRRRGFAAPLCNTLAVALLSAYATPAALAQTQTQTQTPAQTDAAASGPAVITITAQRRVEELQKTPLAVTAISAEQLEARQIRRLDDLKMEVPNVIIEPTTGTSTAAKIFMRGVGTDESMFTADPSVAIYIDDVYIARLTGSLFDMLDLQRVEVLRGPQGTLYGRNATGGAVRYITKKPSGDSRLSADVRLGTRGRQDVSVSGSAKLGEAVAVSYGVMLKQRDGYLADITNGRKVNDEDVKGARLGLAFNLGDATSVRVALDTIRQRSGPQYASGIVDAAKAAQFGLPATRINNADGDLLTIQTDLVNGKNDLEQSGISVSTATDLGAFEWRNIVAARKMHNLLYIDLDGTAQTRFHLFQDQDQKQYSYESQLVSTGKGPFSWTGGVFVFQEENTQPTRQDIFTTGGVNTVAQTTQAAAVYGQADYRITPVWKATGGLRYSSESKNFSIDALKANGTPNFQFQKKQRWSRPDVKLGVDGQFTSEVMGYASVTTGFKSGGFNGRAGNALQANIVLSPETVTTYEIGTKTSWAGGRIKANANVFRNEYKDLQLTAFDPNGVANLINASNARISGVELDLSAQVTRDWSVGMNLGTLQASYTGFAAANAATFSGKDLKQAPKLQYGLNTGYRLAINDGAFQFNAQFKRVGAHYQNLATSELIKTQAYMLLDGRLMWEQNDGKWSAGVWVKNARDTRYYTGGFDIGGLGIADAYINVPRTFGVDARVRFW